MRTRLLATTLLGLVSGLSARADLVTASPGRAPDEKLSIKQSGVPQFDLYQKKKVAGKIETYRVKNIPRLDIGEERKVSASELSKMDLPDGKTAQLSAFQKRNSPAEIKLAPTLLTEIKPTPEAKAVVDTGKPHDVPLFQEPMPLQQPTLMKPDLQQTEIKELAPVDLKLLQALIFLDIQKNYPMALGLFAELLDEAPQYKTEATYHLALTGKGLGLYSEYKERMMKVLEDKNPDWQKRAALSLAQNAAEGDLALVPALDPKLEKFKIEPDKADQYNLNRAKYYMSVDELKLAVASAEKITMDSPLYLDSQFLKGLLQYKSGLVPESILILTSTLGELEKKNPVPELKTIAALTLARLQFQTGDYKGSFQSYLQVDKKHPEWPQAMIEQAWAQILAGDNEGAAGNMFSLHTDFFKNTFAPESYVVRAVGYLNLCQFGDGARVVTDLKKRYTPIQQKMVTFQKTHKSELDYYEAVKTFMRNADAKEIDGLPRGLVWALARHPNFTIEQKNINSIEEQISRYNRIMLDLIAREKFLLTEQTSIRGKIIELKKKLKPGETNDDVAALEKRLLSFKIQHFIVKKARTSIKDIRAQGLARVEKEKTGYKQAASHALAERFNGMLTTLTGSLDQTDVLQYELYAGAGEHLRYQAAGGEITPTEAQGLKPEERKQLKWEFKGEVWEDELGHYRSSLKNVCPEVEGSQQDKVTSNLDK